MKTQKGFIQTPLLIAIVAGILILGGAGYFGVKQYQNSQVEKIEREKLAQGQQKALEQAQVEIEKLKQDSENAKTKQQQLEQKISQESVKAKSQTISASELAPYLNGVVLIDCNGVKGTGSLWNFENFGRAVLTNDHVIEENSYQYGCLVTVYETSSVSGSYLYRIIPQGSFDFNKVTDSAILPIQQLNDNPAAHPIENLNYKISSLRKCPTKIAIGSPVMAVGFPAFAFGNINYKGFNVEANFRTVTEGIISGYDDSNSKTFGGTVPFQDYFVSAKIDSGNSGGITFAKDNNGLCVLGIPTWVSIGNYETQGLVQNIHNVLYKK